MPTASNAITVKCPFYSADTEQTVRCEGICGALCVSLSYRSRREKNRHMAAYCKGYAYESCPVYRMIRDAKYQ